MRFLDFHLEEDIKKNERTLVNNFDSCDYYKFCFLDSEHENIFLLKRRHHDEKWILNWVFNKPERTQGSMTSYCIVDIEEEFKQVLEEELGWFFSNEVAVET